MAEPASNVVLLENTVQHYDWGSKTMIAALRGAGPSDRPEAELWMGAHPRAPSRVELADGKVSLLDLIDEQPDAILGRRVSERFGGRLPYLFKLLAAAKPLSIQAHPDAETARAGYAREEAAGIPRDAGHRNYLDDNHKPEILCALTPFEVLCGFRPVELLRSDLDRLGAPGLAAELRVSEVGDAAAALRDFVTGLLSMDEARRRVAIAEVARAAERLAREEEVFAWVVRLQEGHPGDAGVLAPLFLNLVRLRPGEAVYLGAGELHSYLGGMGAELMANSDNVLRGGLTSKRVDVGELLSVVDFNPTSRSLLSPQRKPSGEEVYHTPAREFELSRIRLDGGSISPEPDRSERGIEILICTDGSVRVAPSSGAAAAPLERGDSCLVAAEVGPYCVEGSGTVYRASVPS